MSVCTLGAPDGAAPELVPDLLVQTLDGVWRPPFHVRDRLREGVYVSSCYVHVGDRSHPLTAEQVETLREQGRVKVPSTRLLRARPRASGLVAYSGAGLTAWLSPADEPGRIRVSVEGGEGVAFWFEVESATEARREARACVAAARRARPRPKKKARSLKPYAYHLVH